jgi:hypothetical protein
MITMKAAELKIEATYMYSGNISNHMLQYIEKQERPRRWIFKRLQTRDSLTGRLTLITSRDPKDDIWALSAHDLKKLLY